MCDSRLPVRVGRPQCKDQPQAGSAAQRGQPVGQPVQEDHTKAAGGQGLRTKAVWLQCFELAQARLPVKGMAGAGILHAHEKPPSRLHPARMQRAGALRVARAAVLKGIEDGLAQGQNDVGEMVLYGGPEGEAQAALPNGLVAVDFAGDVAGVARVQDGLREVGRLRRAQAQAQGEDIVATAFEESLAFARTAAVQGEDEGQRIDAEALGLLREAVGEQMQPCAAVQGQPFAPADTSGSQPSGQCVLVTTSKRPSRRRSRGEGVPQTWTWASRPRAEKSSAQAASERRLSALERE